ncbi:MAG TPA: hypothetical protein ENL08_04645 [Bacteroidetes bacterium]|nr:hypothetical protein [Bacteroidota bacterium]
MNSHRCISRHRFTAGLLLLLVFSLMICCSDDATSPTDSGTPADSGNGNGGNGNGNNGGGTADYGILYFISGPDTPWRADGPVSVSNGDIAAFNQANVIQNGRCMIEEPIDFGPSTHITFTWRENVQSGADYSFLASDSPDRLQSIPFHEDDDGNMAAELDLFMSASIYACFLFTMPPSGSVMLTNIRGYGK